MNDIILTSVTSLKINIEAGVNKSSGTGSDTRQPLSSIVIEK